MGEIKKHFSRVGAGRVSCDQVVLRYRKQGQLYSPPHSISLKVSSDSNNNPISSLVTLVTLPHRLFVQTTSHCVIQSLRASALPLLLWVVRCVGVCVSWILLLAYLPSGPYTTHAVQGLSPVHQNPCHTKSARAYLSSVWHCGSHPQIATAPLVGPASPYCR